MAGTFFGILIALALIYHPIFSEEISDLNIFAAIFTLVATLLLFIKYLASILAWGPIQKAEQEQTPHILSLYEKDRHLKYANIWLLFFAMASYFIAMHLSLFNTFNKNLLLALWIILFGFSLDCLYYYIKRISEYLNPFMVIPMFAQDGIKCIQNERELDLFGNFDALCEVGIKGINQSSPSLTSLSIREVQTLAKSFLEASKSIAHPQEEIKDQVPYTLFYLLQRLELLNDKALDKRLETVCSDLVVTLGKITVYAAKYDMSLAIHPLHYLNLFTKKALEKGMRDTVLRASFALVEAAKAIVTEIDLTYQEIRDPFLSLIGHLETIAKESFKKDKTIQIQVLLQPFLEIRQLFQSDKLVNHPDTPAILADLDRIILEFQTLDTVMKTMPPMPNISDIAG